MTTVMLNSLFTILLMIRYKQDYKGERIKMAKRKYTIILSLLAGFLFLFINTTTIHAENLNHSNGNQMSESQDWFREERSEYEMPIANEGSELPPPPDPPENIEEESDQEGPVESGQESSVTESNSSQTPSQSSTEGTSSSHSSSIVEESDDETSASSSQSAAQSSSKRDNQAKDETPKPQRPVNNINKNIFNNSQPVMTRVISHTQRVKDYIAFQAKILFPIAEYILGFDFLPIYDYQFLSILEVSLSTIINNLSL